MKNWMKKMEYNLTNLIKRLNFRYKRTRYARLSWWTTKKSRSEWIGLGIFEQKKYYRVIVQPLWVAYTHKWMHAPLKSVSSNRDIVWSSAPSCEIWFHSFDLIPGISIHSSNEWTWSSLVRPSDAPCAVDLVNQTQPSLVLARCTPWAESLSNQTCSMCTTPLFR